MRVVRFFDPAEPGFLWRLARLAGVPLLASMCAAAGLLATAWQREGFRYAVTELVSEANVYPIAVPLANALVEDYPASKWHYYRLKARNLRRVGRYSDSLAVYDEAIDVMPDEWWAHSHRCFYNALYGDAASVMDSCDRQLDLGPTEPDVAYDRRAIARVLVGDSAGAIDDFQAALEYMRRYVPGDWRIPVREGWLQELSEGRDPLTAEALDEERSHY